MVKDSLTAFGSSIDCARSLVEEMMMMNEANLEASLEASQYKLPDAQHWVHERKHNKDKSGQLATKVDEAEKVSAAPE